MTGRTVRSARGFTLVEVLVAMMVMATIAVMAWQGVDGIARTRAASQERLEQLLRVNMVLAQWEQDLTAIQDGGNVPAFLFDGASMQLTRRTPAGLQIVVWSLRGGTWLRWAGPSVTTARALAESWAASQQFLGNEPRQLRTLTGISDWEVYCFRGGAWSNCQSTGDLMPPAGTPPGTPLRQAPPEGVRLVLSFGEGSGFTGSATRDVSLEP